MGSKGWNLKFSLSRSDKSTSVGYPFYRPMCNCTISDHRSLNLRCPLRLFNERSINTSDFLVLKLLYHTVCFGHSSTICIKFIVIGSFIVRCPGIKDNNTFFWLSQGIYSLFVFWYRWSNKWGIHIKYLTINSHAIVDILK